jgi:hypothetical protein
MDQERDIGLIWLWLLFFVSGLCLLFQLFPSVWWAFVSIFDIRNWTWRSYAIVCAVALVMLTAYLWNAEDGRAKDVLIPL